MVAALTSLLLLSLGLQTADPQGPPQTRPERTGWQETSTNADLDTFLASLKKLPHGRRLHVDGLGIGMSVQGRALRVVHVKAAADDPPTKLRALIIANIHAGEVEGKEAVQILLREIALGQHQDLLRHVELAVVPVFNVDGNDEIDRGNRVEQNGPDGGVGRRHNSQDRDLNRDFIKAESPEVRALLQELAEFDPHLFMDLHTTNGSYHGYQLTYCTSLNANTDPDLATLMHERLIPGVRKRMLDAHGYRIFDYGNFGRGGPASGWTTFSADPRLAINYVGLRHCLSLLSEAYSYLPFEDRTKVTRAFVLESLNELVARQDEVLKLRAQAEARATTLPFRFGHELAPPVQGELLVGAVEEKVIEGLGKRYMVKPEYHAVQAPLRTRFVAKHELALPKAWAIVGDFPLVAQIVCAHGIEVWALKQAMRVPAEAFAVTELSRQRAAFQGHRLVTLGGKLAPGERELPAGTLIVSAGHRLARLAAQLLEANSDDGLATWGYFDQAIARADEAGADELSYPVLRLDAMPKPSALRAVEHDSGTFPRLVPYLPYWVLHNSAIERPAAKPTSASPGGAVLAVEMAAPGQRTAPRGFESEPRFTGRKLRFKLNDTELESLAAVEAKIRDSKLVEAHEPSVIVVRGTGVSHREIVEACEAVRRTGVTQVFLFHAPR